MITKHGTDHLILHDGEREHRVRHDDFDWMKPHHKGGIHPAITEVHHGYLFLGENADVTGCPVEPVAVTVDDPTRPGTQTTVTMLPINAQLQAKYGPDGQIVTVPINGDAMAQRLHWLKRTPDEQQKMKALLVWMGAWRLADDGTVPEGAS